jgi:prepilin-type N-terminal cleavage/methylation domain-containing protein
MISIMFFSLKRKHSSNRNQGFTLIELLVVIAIIGLLASIVSAGVRNASTRARDARRLSDMNMIKTGMDIFFTTSQGAFPSKATFDASLLSGGILMCGTQQIMKIPQDPMYPTMQYEYDVSGLTYSGCSGSTDLRHDYTITFRLEKDDAATLYTMDSEGNITPALPSL